VVEVQQTENGRWGLFVNGILIGDAKARFDADHAKVMLEKALSSVVDADERAADHAIDVPVVHGEIVVPDFPLVGR
jgi:hypothetical protein